MSNGDSPLPHATGDGVERVNPDTLVREPFARLKQAWQREAPPDERARRASLEKLLAWTIANQEPIAEAISADFSHRSRHETLIAEVFVAVNGLRHALSQLHAWMAPERRPTHWAFLPGGCEVLRQPRGVVGIISPWNYPVQLALVPLGAAIAAGNRVLLKPSELTPRTAEVLTRMVRACFAADQVDIVVGGPDVGAAFARLPFDHLLYTGSTEVGRHVMRAAADNLTPVTLELGGKSPAIVHGSYDVKSAATRIVAGKLLNAGQTCIAPDYVLVANDRAEAFVDGVRAAVAKAYPRLMDNPDYTSIVNERHHARLRAHVDDAARRGAKIVEINPAGEEASGRKMFPTLVLSPTAEMSVMQEEIFGPVLPIVTYATLDEAIAFVNARERPLALYYFDHNSDRVRTVLTRTTSGGVTVNDTLLHVAQEDLPFGGIGASGMGAYHGIDGFRAFSHEKGVFYQARINSVGLLGPPYGTLVERMLKFLIG